MKITEGEFDKLAKSLSEVRLSSIEKQTMLDSIYEAGQEKMETAIRSPFVFFSHFSSQRMVATFAAFVFMVVGTGYAAADSLPGQFLYGIKVKVLEPMVLELTFEEEAKNGYKIHLLQKRVAEMRELQLQAGINLEAEEASYYATERNVDDLETSAIFNEEGVNVEVSTEVETYNNLISKPFQIETTLLKKKESNEREGEEREEEISKTVEKVTEKVKEKTDTVMGTVEGAMSEVEETVKEVEIIKPVEEVTAPVTEILGL